MERRLRKRLLLRQQRHRQRQLRQQKLRLRLRQSNIGTDAHLYGAEARAGGAGNADKTAGRIGMMPAA